MRRAVQVIDFRQAVCWLLALLTPLLWALPAAAHGGGKPQLTGAAAGPYRIYAWTSPEPWRVGLAHTTVAVTLAQAGGQETPLTGAQVAVVYTRSDGASERVVGVEQPSPQVGFYEADAPLNAPGNWNVRVEVAGPAGSGSAAFAENVLPADNVNWWLVGGGVLLALLALGYFGTRKGKAPASASTRKARPGAPSQEAADVPASRQAVQ